MIAFALCFYILLVGDENAEGDDDDEFNKFVHPGIAIIKTVVMLTGEFDAASIDFQRNISSYFIFVIFVFLISTVMFNVLTGLAISDIQVRSSFHVQISIFYLEIICFGQEIKNEADLTHFIHRAELLSRYEKVFLGKTNSEW